MKPATASIVVVAITMSFPAFGDFVDVTAVNVGDLGAGADSWRVYVNFDDLEDRVLAVSGNAEVRVLEFSSTTPLIQNAGNLDGLIEGDMPSESDAGGDTWLTIAKDTHVDNDTQFSPFFLQGDGVTSVVNGMFFTEDDGGYFDANPGTQKTGPEVLIAQFTLEGDFIYSGTVDWQHEQGQFVSSPFIVSSQNLDELGSCCLDAVTCVNTTQEDCAEFGGVFGGIGSACPTQSVEIEIAEPGGDVFVHVVTVLSDCTLPGALLGECLPGPLVDPWTSPGSFQMRHHFGVPGSPAIPPDFFEPGSDPFVGSVRLVGVPLGPVDIGGFENVDFGWADTLVRRSNDPFEPWEPPSGEERTVDLEIVALRLAGTSPITITRFEGLDPSHWHVAVDLSEVHTDENPQNDPPLGTLTATKTHCNGGTYTSILYVAPRFLFTRVDDPMDIRVLDTALEWIPPVVLDASAIEVPWVGIVDASLPVLTSPFCTDFHPGIDVDQQDPNCDCNGNGVHDALDVENGTSLDCDANGWPDECQSPLLCHTDLDADCVTAYSDLLDLLFAWGPCEGECPADLDVDGEVGFSDLQTLLAEWGPCG